MSIISTTSLPSVSTPPEGKVNMVQKATHWPGISHVTTSMPQTIPNPKRQAEFCLYPRYDNGGTSPSQIPRQPLRIPHAKPIYQLIAFRPFNRRRIRVNRPFLSVLRAKKPERRFCTRREGRNVLRLTPRLAVAENARLWGGSRDEMDGVNSADVAREERV